MGRVQQRGEEKGSYIVMGNDRLDKVIIHFLKSREIEIPFMIHRLHPNRNYNSITFSWSINGEAYNSGFCQWSFLNERRDEIGRL